MKKQTAAAIGIVIICIGAVSAALFISPKGLDEKSTPEALSAVEITIQTVNPGTYRPRLSGLGEVNPIWGTTIRSPVEGRIEYLSPLSRSGFIVHEGELLLSLSKTAYELNLATAEAELAAAELEYTREKKQAATAQENWEERSDNIISDPSDLALRIPQLHVAATNRDAAEASVLHARQMLEWTDFRAPYNALVTESLVNPGQTVFSGDPILTLMADSAFEVSISLDTGSWALLPSDPEGTEALLTDTESGRQWLGYIHRMDQHVDPQTRMRDAHIRIDREADPKNTLMPGTFVRATIEGLFQDNLYRLPESAITSEGEIWIVDDENRLRSTVLNPLFYDSGYAYVRFADYEGEPLRIAINPNSTYLNGMAVEARK